MRKLLTLAAGVLAVLGPAAASAQPINYQGRFTDNGAVPVGDFEIRFEVFSAASGGSAVGGMLVRPVQLDQDDAGVFSFNDLDFGPGVFDGQPRWIEVSVRRVGESFVTLAPRQPVNPTPYAIHAQSSGTTLQNAYDNNPVMATAAGTPMRIIGHLQIGSPTDTGVFQIFQQNSATPVVQLFNNSLLGGRIRVRDDAGADIVSLDADLDGAGGLLRVAGDGGELLFDGKKGPGSNSGSLFSITGPASSFSLDTSLTGDDALVLPPASVGPDELFAAPGFASNFRLGNVAVASSNQNNATSIISRSITVPAPGHVIVMATCNIDVVRNASVLGTLIMGVSDESNTMPGRHRTLLQLPGSAFVSGRYFFTGASHGVFEVDQPGQYTYYFNASSTGFGNPAISNPNLTLIYIPTVYGDVARGFGPDSGANQPYLMPLSREDILAEQLAEQHRALQQLRAEQELLREQLERLERAAEDAR